MALTRNALTLIMMMDGMPVVNQGQEQHYSGAGDPYNRQPLWRSDYKTDTELYQWIAKLNHIRAFVVAEDEAFTSSKANIVFNSTHVIAMKKADAVTISTNAGLGAGRTNITLTQKMTGYRASQDYVDVSSCDIYKTTGNGSLNIDLGSEPKIFYPATALEVAGWECEKTGNSIHLTTMPAITAARI